MTDRGADRVEVLFARARELPIEARATFLEVECGDDGGLRHRLEALLVADETLAGSEGAGFLEAVDPVRAAALLGGTAGPAPVQPDHVGRYEVVRRIGQGGMGVVYLARDPTLDRPIAIKLLPPELHRDDRAAERFLGEARAASALDHPNIGTVYEVDEAEDGRAYIAMAYYDGDTIRDRIARGPLGLGEAATLAAQVADGLAAAHAAGIVHRDIKPANLIVTSAGLVKVLDFGIAKAANATATQTGARVGTVAYMSPEQTRGESVDGRADVWSLGVVLYEMLTGVRPFRGDAQGAVIFGIRNDDPEPVTSLRRGVPPALSAVVERCLQKDPRKRFTSAAALVTALREAVPAAARGARSPAARPSSGALGQRPTWRRTVAVGVGALALLLAIAAAYVGLSTLGTGPAATSTARAALGEGDPVILADFADRGADGRLGLVVTEALRIDLLQSPTLRLVGPEEILEGMRRMERDPAGGLPESVARELAIREGYSAVITGEVNALGSGYVLTAKVAAGADGETLAAVRETARDSADLIDAVDRLSKGLRERVGESLRGLEAADPLPRVATASLPALRQYAEARDLARSGGDDARIAALLKDAVALDTAFAAAQRSLATTYWNMRADRARTVDATRRAYALRDRLPERERYLMEATYHWQVRGDARLAAEAYRRVLTVDPDDVVARTNLGLALLFRGMPSEAEEVLRAGWTAQSPPALPLNIARALYFQGRTDAALAVLDSVAAVREASPSVAIVRMRLLGADGRWDEAEALARGILERFADDTQVRAEALRGLWHLTLTRGRLEEAERHFAEMEALLEWTGALDGLARALNQRAEAHRTLRDDPTGALEALDSLIIRPDLDVLSVGATVAPRIAAALAAAGDTAGAARLAGEWEALPEEGRGDPDTFSPELARARIDLAAGRPARAVERLQRASTGTIQAIHYLPDLARAYQQAGRPDSAIAVLERYLDFRHTRRLHRIPEHLGPVLIRLAELYEDVGAVDRAIAAHARLAELWREADPELQPHVAHAQARIRTLSGLDG